MRSIAYYWFVGCDSVTGNHVRRGLRDFSDRLIKGYDQRWAYITVTTYLDPWPIDDPGLGEFPRRAITEAQSDKLLNDFLFDIGTEIMRVDDIKDWMTY